LEQICLPQLPCHSVGKCKLLLYEQYTQSYCIQTAEEEVGYIEFDDAEFAYPTRPGQLVLRKLQLALRQGERIALVGQSGCGKSTIIQLIQETFSSCLCIAF